MAEVSAGPGVEGGSVGAPPSAEGSSATIQRLETQVLPGAQAEAAQKDAAAKEAATPKDEFKVSARVRENSDFQRIWGDYYNAAKTNSPDGEVDPSKIDKLASDRYYSDLAEKMQGEGISQETKDDPLYKQALGSALEQAQKDGKPLDPAEIERRALASYQRQKDLEAGKVDVSLEDLKDPNKLKAAIDALPLTDEQRAKVFRSLALAKEKKKPTTVLEWLLIIVSAVIQETAGLVIPRGH